MYLIDVADSCQLPEFVDFAIKKVEGYEFAGSLQFYKTVSAFVKLYGDCLNNILIEENRP